MPLEAPARITQPGDVEEMAHTALVKDAKVYRNPLIPEVSTGGLQVRAASLNLPVVLKTGIARGAWLNEATARLPVVVLGSVAAERLGIDGVNLDQRIWLGHQWFTVAGILAPSPLEPDIDSSALIGYPAAQDYLGYVAGRRPDRWPARRPRSTCAPRSITSRTCRACSRGPRTRRRRTR